MYVFICQNTHDKTIKADSVAWLPGRQSALTEATRNKIKIIYHKLEHNETYIAIHYGTGIY